MADEFHSSHTGEGIDAAIAAVANKVDKAAGKGLSTNDYTTAEKSKLEGIAAGANNYVHPASHSASIITQDETHRFVTDLEKALWNSLSNEINIMAYGAVGDGETDDTEAIQDALDAANAAGGGTVLIPTGSFVFTSQLTVYTNTTFTGEGSGSILLGKSATAITLIRTATSSAGCILRDFLLNGQSPTYDANVGIGLNGTYHLLSGVRIINIKTQDAVYVESSSSQITIDRCLVKTTGRLGLAVGDSCSLIKITNNYVEATTAGGINIIGGGCSDILVDHNMTYNTGEDSLVGYYPTNTRMVFTNNIGINPGNNGIRVGGTHIKVSNNFFYNPTQRGIIALNSDNSASTYLQITNNYVSGCDNLDGIYVRNYSYIQINDNHVTDNVHDGASGINIMGCSYFNVNTNFVRNSGNAGIKFFNTPYGCLTGNTVLGNAGSGIQFTDDGVGCIEIQVSGNNVKGNTGYGLVAGNASNRINVVGNVIYGNTAGQIDLVGAQSVDVNNIKA